jgi:low temperature requirement protein LtrA
MPDRPPKPPVWPWYVAFCVGWALFYLFAIGFTLFLLAKGQPAPGETEETAKIALGVWLGVCGVLLLAYAVAPLLPLRRWSWIYGIVIVGFSMLGGCFPIAVPLLVFWVKPRTRAFFPDSRAGLRLPPAGAPTAPADALPPPLVPAAPETRAAKQPRLRIWYGAFCVVCALLYLAVGLVGVWSLVDPEMADDAVEDTAMAVVGLAVFPLFAAAPFLPRRAWAWSYGATMIILGMLACCTLPAAIPLLVAWLEPENRAAFGKG